MTDTVRPPVHPEHRTRRRRRRCSPPSARHRVDEFYADVPAELRLDRPLDLPAPFAAEQDLVRHVEGLLAKNVLDHGSA